MVFSPLLSLCAARQRVRESEKKRRRDRFLSFPKTRIRIRRESFSFLRSLRDVRIAAERIAGDVGGDMALSLSLSYSASKSSLKIYRERARPPTPDDAPARFLSLSLSLNKKSRRQRKKKKEMEGTRKKNASPQTNNRFITPLFYAFFRTLRPRGMPPKFILLCYACVFVGLKTKKKRQRR